MKGGGDMNVCDKEIKSFLAGLIEGKVSLVEAEIFLKKSFYDLSDNALEAISHYIDDVDIRKQDVTYEIHTRLDLLDEYISDARNERFSMEQYVKCIACRLYCRAGRDVTKESVYFWIKRRTMFYVWVLKLEFFLGRVCVVLQEGSAFCHSKRKQFLIYDGPWLELNLPLLRSNVLSGNAARILPRINLADVKSKEPFYC